MSSFWEQLLKTIESLLEFFAKGLFIFVSGYNKATLDQTKAELEAVKKIKPLANAKGLSDSDLDKAIKEQYERLKGRSNK